MQKEVTPFLKVNTEWTELEILSEPDVVITFYGYAPYLQVRKIKTGAEYRFYISAKSLAKRLEELRNSNNGIFKGIRFSVRKESMEQAAQYEVLSNKSIQDSGTSETSQENIRLSEDIQKKLEQVLS
ncbi:hypothetical protein F4083_12965 [Candidatus Poribacteria bacterium]|nr:hypothetical protein [Candidatus Poribacteria bacterium]MYB64023.1 hypothetical protein [Candidatus Poribacteria bacterium]MYF56432.1 hypothetical protein [Candidatus Poribacteria bacterium]MYI95206.1 hypothetical protein [Candidatus Poribacteria bacterium]